MVASLCGLHELICTDRAPYRSLVHYFTNILKQAAEGKLGRSWDYHRAPAPFVQMELLRLLALLGSGDAATAQNMHAVVADAWRRAEPLGNNIGNALACEACKTIVAIKPSPALMAHVRVGFCLQFVECQPALQQAATTCRPSKPCRASWEHARATCDMLASTSLPA